MATRIKTGGRQKGTPNKLNATAKDNIASVFNQLGGTASMADWARENRGEFYKIYARLLPIDAQISGVDGGPIQSRVMVEFVNKAA